MWRSGGEDVEVEMWRWRCGGGDGDVEVETWRWRCGSEDVEVKMWRWRGEDVEMKNRLNSPCSGHTRMYHRNYDSSQVGGQLDLVLLSTCLLMIL